MTSKTGVKFIQYEDENVSLKLSIPSSYPESGSVTVISMSFRNINSSVSNDRKLLINSEIESIIERNKGEETLFDIINHLRDNTYATDEDTMDIQSLKSGLKMEIPSSESGFDNTEKQIWERSSSKIQKIKECSSLTIFHGEVTTEKKSRFLSHFAYVNKMAEVKEFREIVLSDKKCATATHNIFAFRFICPTSGQKLIFFNLYRMIIMYDVYALFYLCFNVVVLNYAHERSRMLIIITDELMTNFTTNSDLPSYCTF